MAIPLKVMAGRPKMEGHTCKMSITVPKGRMLDAIEAYECACYNLHHGPAMCAVSNLYKVYDLTPPDERGAEVVKLSSRSDHTNTFLLYASVREGSVCASSITPTCMRMYLNP
jgi:hypothetical protein